MSGLFEFAKDAIYVCDKGHRFAGRTQLAVYDGPGLFEALPYVGDYCTVCYFAWIVANVSKCHPVEESVL